MLLKRKFMRISLIAAASLFLVSCGSDSDDEAPATGIPTDPGGVVNPTVNPEISEPPLAEPGTPSLGDKPTAPQQIVLGECGSMPVSTAVASADAANAASMLLETLVTGRLDPDSLSNQQHYWTIDLAPGRYNLVMDNTTVSESDTNIGIDIYLTAPGEEEIFLVNSNHIDHKVRKVAYFEVVRSTTVAIRMVPDFGAEDYVMGVFTNGTPVPSPYFENCPVFTTMALDTTNSFSIPKVQNAGVGEQWFEVDLAVGDHTLNVDASFPDGQARNLQLKSYWYEHYGQVDRENRVIGFNEIEAAFSGSGPIRISDAGKVWIRFVNPNPEMSVSATLTRD